MFCLFFCFVFLWFLLLFLSDYNEAPLSTTRVTKTQKSHLINAKLEENKNAIKIPFIFYLIFPITTLFFPTENNKMLEPNRRVFIGIAKITD